LAEPQVFISYRRDDTAGYARALHDALARRWGEERVFVDVDDIGAGEAFADVIGQEVGNARVLLVLIGPRWRGERADGTVRLHEPEDFVRREVAAGLARGMRVVPLLLDGATMPAPDLLPEELKPLTGRNAVVIGATSFAADVERLADNIGAPKAPASTAKATSTRRVWFAGAAGVLALAAAAFMVIKQRPQAVRATTSMSTSITPSPRAAINGEWEAAVVYDWPNARYTERFRFSGEGTQLHGSASFLRVPRGIVEASLAGDELRFTIRTSEVGSTSREPLHRYSGRLVADEIRFVMQTEGGSSAHVPVEFIARRR
jgi:TIR domain